MNTPGTPATRTELPFIEACFGRPHARVPVWMMRQAGRFLPEYRKVRERHAFMEMCLTPDVAAEVTLQPVRRFGMDAAILFSDILIFFPALGLQVDFAAGGPRIARPIAGPGDLRRLRAFDPKVALAPVYEAVRRTTDRLAGQTPLVGFAGAPFTLACYAIEGKGSKDWALARAFLHREPDAAAGLLDLLTDQAAAHLNAQVEAGALAVQIFDSWAGVLARHDFEVWGKPYLARLVEAVRRPGVPIIVFARGIPPEWLDGIGADLYNLDWRSDLPAAYNTLKPAGVQGNLDPALLLAGPEPALRQTGRILSSMDGVDRFVFNLGHGILPQTDPAVVQAVVDRVHAWEPAKTI